MRERETAERGVRERERDGRERKIRASESDIERIRGGDKGDWCRVWMAGIGKYKDGFDFSKVWFRTIPISRTP